MKIIFFSCLLSLLVFPVFSQIPVTDAVTAALVEQIALQDNINQFSNYTEYSQTTATLQSTLESIKDIRAAVQEVSAIVTEVVYYKDIINTNLTIISYEIEYITELREDGNISTEELSTASSMFGDILIRSEQLMQLAVDLITGGSVEMENSDRIVLLKEISDEMSGLFMDMTLIKYKLDYVAKDRYLQKVLKGW